MRRAAGAAVLDFETPGQYSGNFRAWAGSGLGYTVTQTNLGAANDYVVWRIGARAGTSTGLGGALRYDAGEHGLRRVEYV